MALRRRIRVLVAGLLASVAVAGVAVVAYGDPRPDLPPIRAEDLVASVIERSADPGSVSGLLTTHVDLGLPSIPAGAPPPDDPVMRAIDAVNGDRRVRLWTSSDGARVALLLPTSEVGWFLSRAGGRTEAWAWDSQTFTAIHFGPVEGHDSTTPSGPAAFSTFVNPVELAQGWLQAMAPTTRVAVGESHRVGGRDAYRLLVEPRTDGTLVGRIEISVDAERRVPLGVAMFARGADSPALSAAFSSISFAPIPPSTYRFVPPEGATVHEVEGWPRGSPTPPTPRSDQGPPGSIDEQVKVFGRGWETVLAIRVPPVDPGEVEGLLPFSGSLFSLRLVDRVGGPWLLVGAVPQARLSALERTLP